MSNKVLAIVLDLSDGSTRKLTVQDPGDVELSDVQTFVNAAMTAGLFTINGVTVQGVIKAYIDEHTITELV